MMAVWDAFSRERMASLPRALWFGMAKDTFAGRRVVLILPRKRASHIPKQTNLFLAPGYRWSFTRIVMIAC
jgi:hypothetical protein